MLALTERHGTPAVSARIVATRSSPPIAGSGPGTPISRADGLGQPAPHRPGEPGARHHPVPAVAGEVDGGVVEVLTDEPGVRAHGGHRRPHVAEHVVVDVDRRRGDRSCCRRRCASRRARRRRRRRCRAASGRRRRRLPSERLAQLRRAQVELRQRRHVEPPDVVVGMLGEVVVAGLRRRRVGQRRLEPAMVVARVVGGQVADHPDAAPVGGVDQRREGGVAAEHRIDGVERRGVVAMARPSREHRREVDAG